MSTVVKDLGAVSAYAYAVEKGYTGTEAEFAELMADYAEVGQRAEDAADSALESKTAAQTAATTATNKASEATTAAATATNKAAEAQADADAAALDASQALSAASTATTKATEATTAAATATSAKTDAVAANTAAQSAKTAAQTAQTGAETAAASVSASAEQIATNAADISQLKSEFADMKSDGVVPSAEQILTDNGVTDCVPYHYRKTGGDGADRLYDEIVGGSLAVNQLENNEYSHIQTSTAFSWSQIGAEFSLKDGNKYLVSFSGKTVSGGNIGLRDPSADIIHRPNVGYCFVYGATSDTVNTTFVQGSWDVGSVDAYINVFDLTQMFGTTIADYIYQLEQTTAGAGVAFFKSLFPNDYYPYNSGELVSVSGLSEHRTVGFNQWDEEWEAGYYGANGLPVSNYTTIRSKNYIRVIPNTEYYYKAPNGTNYRICYFDANKNFIYRSDLLVTGTTFTTQSNCHFIMFHNDGATYNHDICINLSDPTKNGTYKPYEEHSYPLDDSLELRGLPKLDADNNLVYDGDVYESTGKVTRKYGIVDLGTLTWDKQPIGGNLFNFRCSLSDVKLIANNAYPNLICDKYLRSSTSEIISLTDAKDKTIALRDASVGGLRVYDTTYANSTAADFKSAMSGVMLVYELATPTTEEAEPYQRLQQCDPNGTEEYVSTGIVPIGHNSFYPENLRAKVEQLPWNFANLIAPTESAFVATRNYVTGDLFIVSNVLYKATSNIANGGTITPNTNCTATTLAEIISALA